ncbi:MAG TPA: DUF1289 domain-containing protein [Ramlibacter sp.]|nr:DUF1289 domain-containing protein [Ramlibacter sp.]
MMPATELLAENARRVAAEPASDVPSPCISVCKVDPVTQLCEGCFRTLDEIADWSRMADERKREVWRRIGERALPPSLSQQEREHASNPLPPGEGSVRAGSDRETP